MIDSSGAFLESYIDKVVIVILEKDMVDTMIEIDRKIYEKYVIYRENGKKHIYVRFRKAMYRTINAALLYCRNLSKELR